MSDLPAADVAEAIRQAEASIPPAVWFDADVILSTTAKMFGASVEALVGPNRARHLANARTVAMLLLRATGMGWRDMGRRFHRDPNTCARAVTYALGQPHRLAWAKAVQDAMDERGEA